MKGMMRLTAPVLLKIIKLNAENSVKTRLNIIPDGLVSDSKISEMIIIKNDLMKSLLPNLSRYC